MGYPITYSYLSLSAVFPIAGSLISSNLPNVYCMLSKRFSNLIIFILVFLRGNVHCLYFVFVACYCMCNEAILANKLGCWDWKKNFSPKKSPKKRGFVSIGQTAAKISKVGNWLAGKKYNNLKLESRKRICQLSSYLQKNRYVFCIDQLKN